MCTLKLAISEQVLFLENGTLHVQTSFRDPHNIYTFWIVCFKTFFKFACASFLKIYLFWEHDHTFVKVKGLIFFQIPEQLGLMVASTKNKRSLAAWNIASLPWSIRSRLRPLWKLKGFWWRENLLTDLLSASRSQPHARRQEWHK